MQPTAFLYCIILPGKSASCPVDNIRTNLPFGFNPNVTALPAPNGHRHGFKGFAELFAAAVFSLLF